MFALFRKRIVPAPHPSPPPAPSKGLLAPKSACDLLATARRHRLLEHIWHRTSLSRDQFGILYRAPIERYAALVQEFPASESHHHAYPGGMLDHTLEVVAYALKLRQSHLLPIGAPPETQALQAEAWTAGAAYAALLHDIGKIAVDLHVEYADGQRWHPWRGALARPYRFRYNADRAYRLHGAAAGLLYTSVLNGQVLDWLSGFADVWASLLYVLAGQYEHAGVLGEIVTQADRASVAQDLGGDPAKVHVAPKHALQRKLLEGLRYLARQELKLNQPQASDGWLTQDALWLVSKTVCDRLRAYLLSQGVEGIPSNNIRVFEELQDHGIAQPTPDGKAIWRATVLSGAWSHTFTFLKVSPALIWEGSERPPAFAGSVHAEDAGPNSPVVAPTNVTPHASEALAPEPVSCNSAESSDATSMLLDLLNDDRHGAHTEARGAEPDRTELRELHRDSVAAGGSPAQMADADFSGTHFMEWLRLSVMKRIVLINESKALVHTVAGTAYLVSPGIFQRYVHEYPQIEGHARARGMPSWQWAQKSFERLGVHKKQVNGLNIWTCQVAGPRKSRRVHGYVLEDGRTLFAEVPPDNPYLRLLTEAIVPDIRSATAASRNPRSIRASGTP